MTDNTGDHLETEQKYDADADFVLPDLSGLEAGTKVTGRQRYYLSATYYDTEELDLIRNKITLRRQVAGPTRAGTSSCRCARTPGRNGTHR